MFELILFAVVVAPAIGVYLMELGAYGLDVGFGHPNGATPAYLAHAAVLFLTYIAVMRLYRMRNGRSPTEPVAVWARHSFRRLAILALGVNLALVLVIFFMVGAVQVVVAGLNKGEFRASLGGFGPLAYFSRDFAVPLLTALVAFVYRRCNPGRRETVLLGATLLVGALNGAIWGFKAAAIITLLPALVLLVPKLRLGRLAILAAGGLAVMVGFAMLYEGLSPGMALFRVIWRGTVGTGEVAWKVWDVSMDGDRFPYYWTTWWAALGGRGASLAGIADNPWLSHHLDYTELLTLIAKNWGAGVTTEAANVTGTVFAEGVIAFSTPGFVLMSVLAGLVAAFSRIAIDITSRSGRPLAAALAATYFGTSVFTWLNSGGLAVLFFVPFLVYYAAACVAGALLLRLAGISPSRPHTATRLVELEAR